MKLLYKVIAKIKLNDIPIIKANINPKEKINGKTIDEINKIIDGTIKQDIKSLKEILIFISLILKNSIPADIPIKKIR